MAKVARETVTDCCGADDRAAGFEQIQAFASAIRNGYKQFTVTSQKLDDGTRRLVIETSGLQVGTSPKADNSEAGATDGAPVGGSGEGAEAPGGTDDKTGSPGARLSSSEKTAKK